MTQPRPWDTAELAAGNARGLAGGDPLATNGDATEITARTERARTRDEDAVPTERLQDALVAYRAMPREVGAHRRPGLTARIRKAICR